MIIKTDSKFYLAIANALRAKGLKGEFKPCDMAAAIMSIRTQDEHPNADMFMSSCTIDIMDFFDGNSAGN